MMRDMIPSFDATFTNDLKKTPVPAIFLFDGLDAYRPASASASCRSNGRNAARTRKSTWLLPPSDEPFRQVHLSRFSEAARGEPTTLGACEEIVGLLLQHHRRHWPGTTEGI